MRSVVFSGVMAPYPIDVSVMIDQYRAALYVSSALGATPFRASKSAWNTVIHVLTLGPSM